MIKKIAYCLPVAALFMLAACNNELTEVQSPEAMGTDILTAGMPVTRTDLSAGESGVTVNWSKGDKLGVIFKDADGNCTIVPYTLYKGEGTTNASFSGSKVPGATKICAYYPYNAADTYDAEKKTVSTSLGSKLPMGGNIAENSQSQVVMKNAAGVIAIPLTLPEGDTYDVTLTSKGGKDGKVVAISGSATISFGEGDTMKLTMAEEESDNSVTKQIVAVEGTGKAEYIYFPVASGEGYQLDLAVAEEGSSDAEVVTISVCESGKVETGKSYNPFGEATEGGENVGPTRVDSMLLAKVFTDGGTFKLAQDMEMDSIINMTDSTQQVIIDLNGKKLSVATTKASTLWIKESAALTLKNGNFTFGKKQDNQVRIKVEEGGHLTLDNVKATGNGHTFIWAQGPHVQLDILNSTIDFEGYFCMSTNASNSGAGETLTYGDNATIRLTNSHFKAQETALMNNIPADLTIAGCTFLGNHQAALMRGGKYTVSNSTFTLNAGLESSHSENNRMKAWLDGNRCAFAALTVGNYLGSSYQYPTSVDMSGCKVMVEGTYKSSFPAMHVCANATEGKGVTLTLGKGNTITNEAYEWPTEGDCIEYGTGNIMVNGEKVDISYKGMEQAENK